MLTVSPNLADLPITIRSGSNFSTLKTIEIDQYLIKVTVTEGRFVWRGRAQNEWYAPIPEFKGVLFRSDSRHEIDIDSSDWVTWHKLILIHQNEKKSIELYSSQVEADTRRLWAAVASALRLPALHKTGDGIESRTPTDLKKSLRQLAMEGKVSVDFDANLAPPKGIVLEVKQGYRRVTCGNRFFKRCIEITPSELRCYLRTLFGTFSYQDIQLANLISVDRYDAIPAECGLFYGVSGRGAIVEMGAIRRTIEVGGLNDKQSRWLKNFILAVVIAESCKSGGIRRAST
jgi:hypothetical protein